jgi:hypothetical protein
LTGDHALCGNPRHRVQSPQNAGSRADQRYDWDVNAKLGGLGCLGKIIVGALNPSVKQDKFLLAVHKDPRLPDCIVINDQLPAPRAICGRLVCLGRQPKVEI